MVSWSGGTISGLRIMCATWRQSAQLTTERSLELVLGERPTAFHSVRQQKLQLTSITCKVCLNTQHAFTRSSVGQIGPLTPHLPTLVSRVLGATRQLHRQPDVCMCECMAQGMGVFMRQVQVHVWCRRRPSRNTTCHTNLRVGFTRFAQALSKCSSAGQPTKPISCGSRSANTGTRRLQCAFELQKRCRWALWPDLPDNVSRPGVLALGASVWRDTGRLHHHFNNSSSSGGLRNLAMH